MNVSKRYCHVCHKEVFVLSEQQCPDCGTDLDYVNTTSRNFSQELLSGLDKT